MATDGQEIRTRKTKSQSSKVLESDSAKRARSSPQDMTDYVSLRINFVMTA